MPEFARDNLDDGGDSDMNSDFSHEETKVDSDVNPTLSTAKHFGEWYSYLNINANTFILDNIYYYKLHIQYEIYVEFPTSKLVVWKSAI